MYRYRGRRRCIYSRNDGNCGDDENDEADGDDNCSDGEGDAADGDGDGGGGEDDDSDGFFTRPG